MRPITSADLPALAADAARFQAKSASSCPFLSEEAVALEIEFRELPEPLIGAISGPAESPDGWVLGEIDLTIGRVWWFGPFADSAATADAVYSEAAGMLPPEISQEELAGNDDNLVTAAFAERHGFHSDPASACLSRPHAPIPDDASVTIREIRAGDTDVVAELHRASFPASHYTGEQVASGAHHTVFVSLDDAGEVTGYVAAEHQADGSGYIDFLGVADRARRTGLGSKLIAAACRWAARAGTSHVHLTVREDNHGARQLYEALGFTEDAILVPYRKDRIES